MEQKKKVIVYVDGYNFYYGLRNGGTSWRRTYWLDIVKLFERMMFADQELVEVNYYSARPVDDPQAYNKSRRVVQCQHPQPEIQVAFGPLQEKEIQMPELRFQK